MHVVIYSDIACPWCYIGKRRFTRALSDFSESDQVEVVFRPFQLDPSLPHTPQPLKERLREKFGPRTEAVMKHVTSAADEEGLELHFDKAQAVNTLTAHRLLWWAKREASPAVQRTLAEKLFEAHFTHGENVADPEVLADLAGDVGLNRDQVQTYLTSDEGTDEVEQLIEEAQRLGIHAVPTFVFNGTAAVQGAQPSATFLRALEEVSQETAASGEAAANGA